MNARPIRTCVGCGSRDFQADLLRLQLRPAGGLVLVKRPQGGRSAYVHGRAACIEAVAKSRLLRRSLAADVERASRIAAVEDLKRRASLPDAHGARRCR